MFKRFVQNKRGISTVIGAVFFVLILLGGFSTIIWEITEYDNYMQVVNDRAQLDWEKQNELIEISHAYVIGDSLNISVVNNGAIAAHLVDLWVTEYTDETTANWHELFQINYYVNPGDTITGIGSDVEDLEVDSEYIYVVKIVTERGNFATGTSEPEEVDPPPVPYFGVFSLDWFYFKYTSTTNPTPTGAGSISKREDYIAFYIKVQNNHDEIITIKSPSMIMLLIDHREPLFYIVESVTYPQAQWQSTDWDRTTSQKHSGAYSMHAGSSDTTLTSTGLDTSDATSVTVSFWYRDDEIDDSDDVYLEFWDGSFHDDIFELGNTNPEYTWHYYTVTTSDPQYLISDFHIRFEATGIDYGENLWIDDVLVTKATGEGDVTLLDDGFESDISSPSITPYGDDDPITVPPYSTVELIFAGEEPEGIDWRWGDSNWPSSQGGLPEGLWFGYTPEGGTVMTSLAFTMESDPTQMYAQSLPFQAIVLSGD